MGGASRPDFSDSHAGPLPAQSRPHKPQAVGKCPLPCNGRGLARTAGPGFAAAMTDPALDRQIQAIERPDKALWTYYVLSCLVFPPLLVIMGPYLYFRYHTMRY